MCVGNTRYITIPINKTNSRNSPDFFKKAGSAVSRYRLFSNQNSDLISLPIMHAALANLDIPLLIRAFHILVIDTAVPNLLCQEKGDERRRKHKRNRGMSCRIL